MEKQLGMKFDSEKARMGLLPPRALRSVADVLTFGARKYLPDNWRYVENGPERYLDAAMRHIVAYMQGEDNDPESSLPHLSHALCCLMFIVDLSEQDAEDERFANQMEENSPTIEEVLDSWARATMKENNENQ
jgi:Domain of unknown function (DUF5664)